MLRVYTPGGPIYFLPSVGKVRYVANVDQQTTIEDLSEKFDCPIRQSRDLKIHVFPNPLLSKYHTVIFPPVFALLLSTQNDYPWTILSPNLSEGSAIYSKDGEVIGVREFVLHYRRKE